MPRPRQQPQIVPPPEEQEPTPYNLEPMTENLRSRLNVLGNSMQMTIGQLQDEAPEWATFLNDIFQTIGGLMEISE